MMPVSRAHVTYSEPDLSILPDAVVKGVSVGHRLHRTGLLSLVGERVLIRRQGGYCGLDVFLFLLIYFMSPLRAGLRPFFKEWMKPYAKAIGVFLGRKRLCSPASLSRALSAVEPEYVREVAPFLLLGLADPAPVMSHPVSMTYDCEGTAWHTFDIDPTVTTIRHRGLPLADDLPEPIRDSRHTAAPGYSGRKRGDVQFRRIVAQHSGSSLWVHAHLSEGNGDSLADLKLALKSIDATRRDHLDSKNPVLVRLDGEYGHVGALQACRDRDLPVVARLRRPSLLSDPHVLTTLRHADRVRVPDSLSGPARYAVDLGSFELEPTGALKSELAPLHMRVVAGIFAAPAGERAAGNVVDGFVVELFAVDLNPLAWPAAEALALYFGRTAQENRFAQEDRQVGLDRILSYHLPGQELASVVGLMTWNLRTIWGFEQAPPHEEDLVPQRPRSVEVARHFPSDWPKDRRLSKLVEGLPWEHLLRRQVGWKWDMDAFELLCPDGFPMTLSSVYPLEYTKELMTVAFTQQRGQCQGCPLQARCFSTLPPRRGRQLRVTVDTQVASKLKWRLDAARRYFDPRSRRRQRPSTRPPGPMASQHALLLPARVRSQFDDLFDAARIIIELDQPPPVLQRLRLVAQSDAERQRRRLTWKQKRLRYQARQGAKIEVEFLVKPALQAWLDGRSQAPVRRAG